jgi:hypothetical protein
LILVAIVIFFPQTVTVFLDKEKKVDLDKVKIEIQENTGNDKEIDVNELFKKDPPAAPAK